MRQNVLEVLVGACVVVIAVLFFTYVYATSGVRLSQDGYRVTAVFQNVEGVRVGSDIRLGGVKVGSVVQQSLDPETYDVTVTFSLARYLKIPEDTTVKITSDGLLGAKFLALEPGGSDVLIEEGGRLAHTQGAIDLWAVVSDFLFSAKGKNRSTSQQEEEP